MGHVCALHIDNYVIPTPTRDIHLNKVLHVPSTSKNIASINRLTYDNNVSIEFHPFSFLIKDRATQRVILHGRCEGSLYPLPSLEHSSSPRCVLSVNKINFSLAWQVRASFVCHCPEGSCKQ
jgi:hypothetical protein